MTFATEMLDELGRVQDEIAALRAEVERLRASIKGAEIAITATRTPTPPLRS